MKIFTKDLVKKRITKAVAFRMLMMVGLCLGVGKGLGQQIIGTFPSMDGGIEGQTAGTITGVTSIATGTQRTDWTVNSGANISGSGLINATGGRSGPKYITYGSTGSTARRLQSPTAANAAIVNATPYTVQYYYRTSGATNVTNGQRGISPDGTAQPGTYGATTMAGTSGVWTLIRVSQTSGTSAASPKYGIGIIRFNTVSTVDIDVDDFVIYAGGADNTAPASAGTVTVGNPTTSSLDVSWTPSAGVDGGGYVVVRYAISPNADNDPNQNGIYALDNTHTNGTGGLSGTVRFIGTGTSFTDNVGLSQGTTYYYKVYTVDKAFNYSTESQASGTTSVPATPTFTFTGVPLSTFNTSIGTPSAEQVYTISGINLTINQVNGISITAPADFEVSLTSGTYTGSNGNTVTLSSDGNGNIVGQPVNIYVRYFPSVAGSAAGNITHSGAGVSPAANVAVSGVASGYYYSKSSGDLTDVATWGTATDGTGTSPVDFTSSNQTFEIRNRVSTTIIASWVVSGSASKIIVGTGADFAIPSTNTVTGTIDVLNGGELTLENSVLPTIGLLAAGSTVEYAQTAATSILNTTTDLITYSNLKLSNSGIKSFKNSTTMVTGNLIYDGSTNGALNIEAASAATFTTISLGGNLTYFGTVINPVDANSYTLLTTGSGTQTITGNGNTARFFRITNNIAGNNVILSTVGGSTNALVGNATGGGVSQSSATASLSLNGNTLTFFAGNTTITGTGTIGGSATSNIVINSTSASFGTLNFTSGDRSLDNLTLATVSGVTLGTALDIYGTITLTSASLNLNAQNLTLKSNTTGTARIADLTGSTLTGATNVTMERWIKLRAGGTGRAYRLLAPTVNTAGSIRLNWMENGLNTAIGSNDDPVALHGTQITGTGGNGGGFDVTASNAPSLYTVVNGVTPTYNAVSNTTGTLNALTGYFLYIRGDRSMNMTLPLTPGMPTSSTTLRTKGTLLSGNQTFTASLSTGDGIMNLVTNPYASPISWNSVFSDGSNTNLKNYYTLWDPNVGSRGGFVTVTEGGGVSILNGQSGPSLANINIQPGQAFFVTSDGAAAPTLIIKESHKSTVNNNDVFLVSPESFSINLFFNEPNNYRRIADGVSVFFDNTFMPGIDANDALEINNWDENIAIARESKHLAIEARPVIISRDTIPLFMNNMKQQAYEFEFTPAQFTNIGLKAELIDNFLNTRTLLSVVNSTVVSFSITADPASSTSNRFMIVFGPMAPLAIDQLSIKAQGKYQPAAQGGNGVQVDWIAKTEKDMDRYEVERSFDGSSFTRIKTVAAIGNSTVPTNYTWLDAGAQTGDNFYRVKAIDIFGLVKYTSIVKVNFGKATPTITVNPNPVRGNSFNLQLTDVAKGSYTLQVINNLGQVVYRSTIQHAGGSANIPVSPGKGLVQGVYELVLTGDGNTRIVNRIVKN